MRCAASRDGHQCMGPDEWDAHAEGGYLHHVCPCGTTWRDDEHPKNGNPRGEPFISADVWEGCVDETLPPGTLRLIDAFGVVIIELASPGRVPEDGLPCIVCNREPHKVVTYQGDAVRYVERHEPDCPLWP